MVISLESIAPHLQQRITQKMDFKDFMQFEESSKQGKHLGSSLPPIVDIMEVVITPEDIKLMNYGDYGESHCTVLPNSKEDRKNLRFSINLFKANEDLSEARYLDLIREMEAGAFVIKNSTLALLCYVEMTPDVFSRLLETLNVTMFACDQITNNLQTLLNKIKNVEIRYIQADEFGRLKSQILTIHNWLPPGNPHPVINKIFKEWASNERQIDEFTVSTVQKDVINNLEELFSGFSHTVLWSPETHEYSLFAKAPLED